MTDGTGGREPAWMRRLSSPAGMVLVWTLHGLLFVVAMPWFTPSIAHVDANSADILQRAFSFAYQSKNPPLYEWLELAVQAAIGPGPRSFLVVRYAIMGLLAVAVWALVSDVSGSRLQGAAASLGLMSFYWFAWFFHDSISHSILVALACVVFLHLVLAWLRAPGTGLAVLLGLAAGFGLMAKLNFAIIPVGVAAAMALDRTTRARLLDARLLLSAAIAAAMIGPLLLAASRAGGPVGAVVYDHVVDAEGGAVASRVLGGGKLLANYVLFLLPWGLVALAAFRPWRPANPRRARDPGAERFLIRLALTTAALVFVAVVAVGARSVSERYLFPVLLAVPLWVHVAWGRRADPARALAIFAGVAAAVLVAVMGVRAFNTATATLKDKDNKRYEPFDRLAEALEARGLGEAFFVAEDRYEAGNLMAYLPGARAAGLATQRRWTPMSYPPDGRCVLLFRGPAEDEGTPPRPAEAPASIAALMPADAIVETLRVPWRATPVGPARTGVFHIVDLGTGSQACRTVFGPRAE